MSRDDDPAWYDRHVHDPRNPHQTWADYFRTAPPRKKRMFLLMALVVVAESGFVWVNTAAGCLS